MPMTHSFHLLAAIRHSPSDYATWPRDSEGVEFSDDLVGYMWDALSWVPCKYPHSGMRKASGPDRYGPSVVEADGAATLEGVLSGFADVFSRGPETLRLNCGPSWIETGDPADATAETMTWNFVDFPRDEIVGRLRRVAEAARTVSAAPGNWFIAIQGL